MEIKSEVNHFNISKICRTCLIEKDVMKAIFAPDESIGQSVAERIMGCTNIQLAVGDGLPSLICLDCVHQANRAFSFKQLCEQSDMNLRQFLERLPSVVDIKKEEEEIEATHYGLVSHNCDKDDEGYEDFSMLTKPDGPANIKEEKIDATDCQVVDSLVGNLELYDSSTKCSKKDEGFAVLVESGVPTYIKQEEAETIEVAPIQFIEVVDNFKLNGSSDDENNKDISMFTVPVDPADIKQEKVETTDYEDDENDKDIALLTVPVDQVDDNKVTLKEKKILAKADLKSNMVTHTNERYFECNICQKRFTLMFLFNAHMMIHKNETPFECNICQKRFTHADNYKTHMMIHKNGSPFECNICQKKFTHASNFKTHMMIHKNGRPFECNICQKKFTQAYKLKLHMMIHTNERPFECNICQKKFTQACKLKTHMVIHRNEKPFECNICQKKFTHACNFKAHMMIHRNERPYECNICQKKFTNAYKLKLHMMIHTNERAFECNICQKGLQTKTTLNVHMRTHTNERPFACEFCKKAFRQSYHLTEHKRLHVTKTN